MRRSMRCKGPVAADGWRCVVSPQGFTFSAASARVQPGLRRLLKSPEGQPASSRHSESATPLVRLVLSRRRWRRFA